VAAFAYQNHERKGKKIMGEKKSIVQLRLTSEEREMLEVLAKRKGLKLGSYLKMLIHDEYEEFKATQPDTQTG
jgi:predicted DNA binding CopG/RHH family protein